MGFRLKKYCKFETIIYKIKNFEPVLKHGINSKFFYVISPKIYFRDKSIV